MGKIRIGQFSQSPNLLVIKKLNLLPEYDLEISNVASSPSQFNSLHSDELDIAITSPDNVLLFGTTAENPIHTKCDLTILRSIDKGLKLSLFTRQAHSASSELQGLRYSIDSPASGFSFLLKSMARKLGNDPESFQFVSGGSTPKRLTALIDSEADATILNAESAVRAEELGFKNWMDVSEISQHYLGTVLSANKSKRDADFMEKFLMAWDESMKWLLDQNYQNYCTLFGSEDSKISSQKYFDILQSPIHGLTRENEATVESLKTLIEIRIESGGYVPPEATLAQLFT